MTNITATNSCQCNLIKFNEVEFVDAQNGLSIPHSLITVIEANKVIIEYIID